MQYQSYMALSDLSRQPSMGSAGALAFGTLDKAQTYQDANNHLSELFTGVRVMAFQCMAGATPEELTSLACTPQELKTLRAPDGITLQEQLTKRTKTAHEMYKICPRIGENPARIFDENLANAPKPGVPAANIHEDGPLKAPAVPAMAQSESIGFNDLARDAGKTTPATTNQAQTAGVAPKINEKSAPVKPLTR